MKKIILFILSFFMFGCSPEYYEKSYISEAFRATSAEKKEELYSSETKHFVIYSATDIDLSGILEKSYERFYKDFRFGINVKEPKTKLIVICFKSYKDMEEYGKIVDKTDLATVEAYYSPKTNIVALVKIKGKDLQTRIVTHEIAHQLSFNSGILDRRIHYPTWVGEGLSTNFETNSIEKIESTQYSFSSLKKHPIALEKFAGELQELKTSPAEIFAFYEQAWGLFKYLSEERPLSFDKYLKDISGNTDVTKQNEEEYKKIFVSNFGKLDKVQKEFLEYANKN